VPRHRLALIAAACTLLSLPSLRAEAQPAPALAVPAALIPANADRSFPGLWEPLEAGAVLVRANDPAAVWYNPAGIIQTNRSAIAANAPGYEYTTFGGSNFDRPAQGSSFRGLPNFVGAILGSEVIPWRNVRLGFGLSNPISWRQGLTATSESMPGTRSIYSVSSEIESFQAQGAVAYAPLPNLRLGFSLGVSWDSISTQGQSNAEATNATTYSGSLNYSSVNAATQQFVSAVGVQWETTSWLSLGLVLRPPAVRLFGSGTVTYDGVLNTGTEQQAHFQSDGPFEFRQPLEIELGVATHYDKLNIELNLFWHQASGTYTLFHPNDPLRLVTAQPGGTSPMITSVVFPDIVTHTRAILNGSIGGNYRIDQLWWLHGGFYIDQAPTGSDDPFFQSIDFYGVRVGCSLREEKGLSGSIGLGYELGLSNRPPGPGTPVGGPPPPASGSLNIHTFSLLLAIGYKF
jgi:hypothetical protein